MTSTTSENESQTDIIDKVNEEKRNNEDKDDDGGGGGGDSGDGDETRPPATAPMREDYEYVIDGLSQWLNNKPKESETFFKSKSDSTTILVGYAFVLCMNGVISFEMDKIDKAQTILKLLEKRCTASSALGSHSSALVNNRFAVNSFNWLSNVRYKIFGNVASLNVDGEKVTAAPKTPAQLIEEQIILADVYMSLAILTFLTQDITGLMKGSWLLRKAWKIYQRTYTQLYELYAERFGSDGSQQPPMPLNYSTRVRQQIPRSVSHFNWISPSTSRTEIVTAKISRPRTTTNQSKSRNGAAASSLNRHDSAEPFDDILESPKHDMSDSVAIAIFNSDPKPAEMSKSRKALQLDLCQEDVAIKTIHQYPKTCSSNGLTPLTNSFHAMSCDSVDSTALKRLMGAASFGYGIFQLTASLLPAKLLKIISIFGFEGNRDIGVACLLYARCSTDMRAILATLALLWFYTFGTQLFRNEDGYSKDKIDAVANLLDENRARYQQSAIFLFFHGRLERMKANADTAVEYFEKSYRLSAQTELKLLCLHEIAWCKLIQLDFHNAAKYFNELRLVSVYSKAFYTYMTAICQGAVGNFDNLIDYREEISTLLRRPTQKQSHILTLLQNRVHRFPSGHNDLGIDLYWKYLCYEMLFLWSVLSSVPPEKLTIIIEECSMQLEPVTALSEPMVGLRELLIGCAETALKNYSAAIDAYQRCIERRSNVLDVSMHISAFAHYELAAILIHQKSSDVQEMLTARKLLLTAQKYQNYDLENRLCVQIQQELKKLTHSHSNSH